jgi:hypothetical protein
VSTGVEFQSAVCLIRNIYPYFSTKKQKSGSFKNVQQELKQRKCANVPHKPLSGKAVYKLIIANNYYLQTTAENQPARLSPCQKSETTVTSPYAHFSRLKFTSTCCNVTFCGKNEKADSKPATLKLDLTCSTP